ncbi:hypothetical protein [Methylobacterium sp. Leaf466]|uniref:hypothetical protein n=1 Tax=Methylobacterium sp. Leaf466 TaxID=1736386 RepID=UPI000701C1E6|nr:hypothetical protein [Methylobacterium sp. Leaf466]KQT88903.1 hypothetical protein ASG59_13600 [Methylobacterium sp. Leaf466]
MPLVSHLITCQAADGLYHQEDRAGLSFAQAVRSVADGTPFPLASVHRVDFASGTIADVTCAALHAAVDWWRDAYNADLPGCLWAACEAYGVERYDPTDAPVAHSNVEHRLDAFEIGLSRAA